MTQELLDVLNELKLNAEKRKVDIAINIVNDSAVVVLSVDSYAESIYNEILQGIKSSGNGRVRIEKKRKGNMLILSIPRSFITKQTLDKVKKIVEYLNDNKVHAGYSLTSSLNIVVDLSDYIDAIVDSVSANYNSFNFVKEKIDTKYSVKITKKESA